MSKENLIGQTKSALEQKLVDLGEKPFHGRQLFKWLYNTRQYDFSQMSDMSTELRAKLDERFCFESLTLESNQLSDDGTQKFLFRLDNGNPVETVLIPEEDRKTLCVSSQSGCALACRFCATGTMGLIQDLSAAEIVGQMISIQQMFGDDAFTNVVFMGMGEPFHNYDNLLESLSIMTDHTGMALAPKRITVSTSGVTPKIKKLADSGSNVRLALSLHAATQKKRLAIMPIAKTFSLNKLMEAVHYYTDKTGKGLFIEYVLMNDFNDKAEDIRALTKLLHGLPCKINILAYNPVAGLPFERPSEEKTNWFGGELRQKGFTVTIRRSRGTDIAAACGQLAAQETTLRKEHSS